MNIFPIASLLASLSCLAVGCLVYFKDRTRRLNQSFALITFLAGTWTSFPFLTSLPKDDDVAIFVGRIVYLFAAFVPTAFYYFVLVLLNKDKEKTERRLVSVLFLSSTVFAASAFSSVFIQGIARSDSLFAPTPGILYVPFMAFFASGCGSAFYKCFISFRTAVGARRNQLKYVLASFALAYTAGFLHFRAVYGIPEPFPHDFLLILFAGTISYAIAKHRVMDITVVMHKGLTYALLLGVVLVPAYVAVTITERGTLFSTPPLLAGTLVFASGLWIILKNPWTVTNRTFGLLCLALSTWLLSFFMIYSAEQAQKSIFWGKFLYIGVVYIPAFFYHFCVSFLQLPAQKRAIVANYAISTVFLMFIPTSYLVNGQYAYYWGYYPKAGMLHPLFLAYFATVGGLSLRSLYLGYKSTRPTDSQAGKRIRFVFWTFLFGFAASVDFLQSYGVEFYPPGFLFVSLWVMLVTYAIARYRFLDISLIVNRSKILPYAQGAAITLSFYVFTVFLIQMFTGSTHYLLAAVLLAASVVCAELLVTFHRRLERAVGKALFKDRHEAYETLSAFSKDLVTILDLKDLNKRFVGTLSRVLSIPRVSLFLLDQDKEIYTLAASLGLDADHIKDLRIPTQHPLPLQMVDGKTAVLREELEYAAGHGHDQAILETLRTLRAEACLPLMNKDHLVGFCNLGPRVNSHMYTEEDLNLLRTLAQNAAIALDNAMLYESLKRSHLLMQRTNRLRSLEIIAGGFAHEIRNPLTSIKTFIQLAPERKDDPEFIIGFSKVVNDDVNRIERLIEEILDYARYMIPRPTLEDLNDIASSCIYFVQIKAESYGIRVEKVLADDLPLVRLDRQQMKQVMLNLLLNGLDAMAGTGGRLTLGTKRLLKPSGEEWVQVEVSDTGPGIEAANQEHIFDPFYTTKHHSGEREGTGLGLAIVHQIVQEHHGTIQFESTVGKGTTFLVTLPVGLTQAEPSPVREEHEEAGPVGR